MGYSRRNEREVSSSGWQLSASLHTDCDSAPQEARLGQPQAISGPQYTQALGTQALVHATVLGLHVGECLAQIVGSLSESAMRLLGQHQGPATSSLVGLVGEGLGGSVLGATDGTEGVLEIERVAVEERRRLRNVNKTAHPRSLD